MFRCPLQVWLFMLWLVVGFGFCMLLSCCFGLFTALVLFMFGGCDVLVFIIVAFTGCGCVGLGCFGLLLWFCVCLLDYVNGCLFRLGVLI